MWLHDPAPRAAGVGEARSLARLSLELAVPQAIAELAEVPGPVRLALARDCAAELAVHGNALWITRRVATSDAGLTWLARGLAALAYEPGGVRFLGLHWDATVTGL